MPNLITNPDDIRLNERQELLQFIGKPPSVFLRFGITAVACVMVVFAAMSYFIKYPDVVTAKVVLTTENPPIRVVAKTGGRVFELLVKNNEVVQAGQIVAVMENTGNWHDVLKLEKQLSDNNNNLAFQQLSNLRLGTLQNAYSTFTQNLKDYHYFLEKNGVLTKIQYLNQQIDLLKALNGNLLKQKNIQNQESELGDKELRRQKQLHTEGVISDAEFEKVNSQYFQQKRQIEANEAAFINNQMQIGQHEAQINDLSQSKSDNQNNKELTLQEDTRRLKSAVEEWKNQYLVIAPIAGNVTLAKVWSPQQSIASGDEVLTVVPHNVAPNSTQKGAGKMIVKAILPVANSGKVKLGLKTNIRFDAYPYQQYGIVEGTVQNIALVPQAGKEGDTYLLEISINDSLSTTYGKKLKMKQEMQGSANIITEDRRVIERVYDRFQDLKRNRG